MIYTTIILSISIITLGFTIVCVTKIIMDYKIEDRKIAYDTAKMYFQIMNKDSKEIQMLEVLQFIFSDFWHFLGSCILLEIICNGFRNIINIIIPKRD